MTIKLMMDGMTAIITLDDGKANAMNLDWMERFMALDADTLMPMVMKLASKLSSLPGWAYGVNKISLRHHTLKLIRDTIDSY